MSKQSQTSNRKVPIDHSFPSHRISRSGMLRIVLFVIGVAILVLEILPYGAVLYFSTDDLPSGIRRTFSFFDLVPYGYANFGPLLTALSSVLLLILSPFSRKGCMKASTIVNLLAVITSLLPLFYGLRLYSFIAFLITLLLAGCLAIRIWYLMGLYRDKQSASFS